LGQWRGEGRVVWVCCPLLHQRTASERGEAEEAEEDEEDEEEGVAPPPYRFTPSGALVIDRLIDRLID
jgi:hypothetical protein